MITRKSWHYINIYSFLLFAIGNIATLIYYVIMITGIMLDGPLFFDYWELVVWALVLLFVFLSYNLVYMINFVWKRKDDY